MMPLGIGVAASVRVGNFLGAGRPDAAKRSGRVAMGVAICAELMENLLLFWQRHHWGYLFTNDETVVEMVAVVLMLTSVFNILDGMQAVFAGIFRGCGQQMVSQSCNVCEALCPVVLALFVCATSY